MSILSRQILATLLVLNALPVMLSASQPGTAGTLPAPAVKSGWQAERKNPYRGLFKPNPVPFATVAAKPEAKCRATTTPADPSIHKWIRPGEPQPEYTIRSVDPTCR